MNKAPFTLSARQVQFLLIVGFLCVGYALYLRYLAIEFSQVALACDAPSIGPSTILCKTRLMVTALFKNSVFGIVAIGIALLNLLRPSIVTITGALIAACFGVVLYNIGLSGVAIGLLALGFARPAPATA